MDLELARNLGKHGRKPRNHVRFLWVGAEEEGLLGSHLSTSQLSDAEKREDHRDARLRHGGVAELGAPDL